MQKNNWSTKKLGEVADILGGYAFKSKDLKNFKPSDNYFPVIKIGNLKSSGSLDLDDLQYFEFSKNLTKFLIKKDDILVAMTGATTGKGATSGIDRLLLNQRVGLIRSKGKIVLQNYLKSILLSDTFYKYCQITAGGGAQGNISPSQIMDFALPLPDLPYQEKIVERLDAIRKAQELCDIQIQKTEELFESIFISGITDGVSKNLGELFDRQSKSILPIKTPDEEFNFIGLENIESNTGNLVNFNISKGIQVKSSKFVFQKGDVLYGKLRPYLNKVWLADFDGICSTDIWVLRPNLNNIDALILSTLLKSQIVVKRMSSIMTGTNLPRANSNSFDSLTVKIPTLNNQKELTKKLYTIQDYKKLLLKQKSLLKELFDSVLYKSMNGEMDGGE